MKLRSRLSLYTLIISGASFFVSVVILVTFDYTVNDSPKFNPKAKVHNVQNEKPHHQPLVQQPTGSFPLLPTANLTLLSRLIDDKLNDAQFMDKLFSSQSIIDLYFGPENHSFQYNQQDKPQSIWKIAANWINAREIIPENASNLDKITRLMAEAKIIKSSIPPKGTQLKVMLVLEGNQQALFKPMRFPRDHIINGEPYAGPDRHNGEIVAFHLSRILNLRTAPVTIGRRINVAKELKSTASENLSATFLTQPKESTDCFYGRCLYCNQHDYVCPSKTDGYLEGALVLMFPSRFRLERVRSPWQRTYKSKVKAKWENDSLYCYNRVIPVLTTQRILDLIDTSIFDYLIGNADRHHYEIFRGTPESAILLIDNGKSFGNPFKDELSILAPLYQCCLIRESTYKRLLTVEKNGLSNLIEKLTRKDPLYPLLTGEHLFALDRRLKQILALVDICLDEKGESKVFQ